MKHSHIAWTDHSFNPWSGCSRVSPGCTDCYAAVHVSTLIRGIEWGPKADRVRSTSTWNDPPRWNREAEREGRRARVFCASLADVFDTHRQVAPWRDELHTLIEGTPNLDWLVLTKRPEVAEDYYRRRPVPKNVWLGTTCEDQTRADQRIPILLRVAAKVRFVSCEPVLGPLDIERHLGVGKITWVICGGETTFNNQQIHRPMNLQWARSLREQAKRRKVAFFFKQIGGRGRAGRDAAGTLLDGREHLEVPRS